MMVFIASAIGCVWLFASMVQTATDHPLLGAIDAGVGVLWFILAQIMVRGR